MPKGTDTNTKTTSLEVYADDKKLNVQYFVLTYLTVFVQTLNDV